MITLKTDRLRVEISEPGECPNNTARFDRAGFISEVVLDGAKHFCANEPQNLAHPSSGGRGFCSEIKPDLDKTMDTSIREFPKFGIGIIPRTPGKPYKFFNRYENVQYFPVRTEYTQTEAIFTVEPILCEGYALRETKKITAEGNNLRIDYCFENAGKKTLELSEYCHNFISVDGMAISPDYKIDFPMLKDFGSEVIPTKTGDTGNLIGNGHGFTFRRAETGVMLADVDLTDMQQAVPFQWSVRHEGAKACVKGEDGFVPSRVTFWSVDHMTSPEIFHSFSLAPGEKHSWYRKLMFED